MPRKPDANAAEGKGSGNAGSKSVRTRERILDAAAHVLSRKGYAGARLSDVVKATVFVTDRAYMAGVTDVVLRHLGPTAPCLSTLIIKGLASPELVMEVDITAMVQGDDA